MAQTDLINEGLLADYHDELMKDHIVGGTVFDISSYHATGTPPVLAEYANLAAALGTNGANVPESMRKGGMSVKFVLSSDNKYVCYMLTKDEWSTDVTYWHKINIEDEVVAISRQINGYIPLSLYIDNGHYIFSGTGTGATYREEEGSSCLIIPVNPGDAVKLTKNPARKFQYAFFQNSNFVVGQVPNNYAGDYTRTVGSNYFNGTAPEDAHYLYLLYTLNNADYLPANIYINGVDLKAYIKGLTEKVEDLSDSVQEIENDIQEQNVVINGRAALYHQYVNDNISINSLNKWADSIGCLLIPVKTDDVVVISATTSNKVIYTLLSNIDNTSAGTSPSFADGMTGTVTISAGITISPITISSAKWLYVQKPNESQSNLLPASIKINGEEYMIPFRGHEQRIESLETGAVTKDDAFVVMFMGSSLTHSYYKPVSTSWIERLNDFTDANIVNWGYSGKNLMYNNFCLSTNVAIQTDTGNTARGVMPNVIVFGNMANGTKKGAAGQKELLNSLIVCSSFGAKMVVGSEEDYAGTPKDYEQTFRSFALAHGLDYSMITSIWRKCYPANRPFKGDIGNNHGGYRLSAPYMKHLEMLNAIPIEKSVKMYKVRPSYKNGSPVISNLVYDTNEQRAQFWTAISSGAHAGETSGSMDNLDNHAYNVQCDDVSGTAYSETSYMKRSSRILFSKFALVEFILDKVHISKFNFKTYCSNSPANVYIAKYSSLVESATAVDTITTFEETEFIYDNITKYLTVSVVSNARDIQLYDKVRIVIERSDGDFSFSLYNPEITGYDGIKKISTFSLHKQREYGVELLTDTNPTTSWTLVSGAKIASFPSAIANYTSYNNIASHIQLDDDGDGISKSITLSAPAKKIAARIVAQAFKKYASTRWNGTELENGEYTANTSQYAPFDYDYGKIRVVVNNNVKELIVYQGWAELYFEVDVEPDDDTLNVVITKKSFVDASYSNDDMPILIHDISIQSI